MQADAAQRLRERWGDKPCDHPDTEKEYYLGAQTGDRVCTKCGRSVGWLEDENLPNPRIVNDAVLKARRAGDSFEILLAPKDAPERVIGSCDTLEDLHRAFGATMRKMKGLGHH